MGRQAPRKGGREHVILEDKLLSIGPVIGDLPRVVKTHDIWGCIRRTKKCVLCCTTARTRLSSGNKAVHLAAVDVCRTCGGAVRSAAVDQRRIMVRLIAATSAGVRHTNGELTIFCAWQALGTRVGVKVAIKRTILLHAHDDVCNLLACLIELSISARCSPFGALSYAGTLRRQYARESNP